MILVVDASVTVAWIAADEQSAYADSVLAACGTDRALVPALWRYEFTNTLIVLERKGRIADAQRALTSAFRHLPIGTERDPDPLVRSLDEVEIARRYRLNVYDAAYLACAKSTGLRLATLDAELARAADAEGLLFRAA